MNNCAMNSLKRLNVTLCGSQPIMNSIRSMSKEIFPPSNEPEIPAYQEKLGESVELRKASDPFDVSGLSWDVDLDRQSPLYENFEEEPLLTSLVRHQYMKRLQQCLHENFHRYDKSKDVGESAAEREVQLATILEKKALRSCMMAKLYIRSMLTIINDIKCYQDGKVSILDSIPCLNTSWSPSNHQNSRPDYIAEPNTTSHSEAFPSSISSQEHTRSQSQAHRHPQPHLSKATISPETSSVIESTNANSEKVFHVMKIPTIDEVRKLSSENIHLDATSTMAHSHAPSLPLPSSSSNVPLFTVKDLNDISSILDSIPLNISPPRCTSSLEPNFNGEVPSNYVSPLSHEQFPISLDQRLEQLKNVLNIPADQSFNEAQSVEISSSSNTSATLPERHHNAKRKHSTSFRSFREQEKLMKSEALEMANKRISEVVIEDEQKLFEERVSLVYNLEQQLQLLDPTERERLEILYVKLFGPEHNYFLDLSEERQYEVAKRRIATKVVSELEPYYCKEDKRIGNKNLFKFLAKYITDAIFNINSCADAAEVKERVSEFFVNGRTINCEADIYGDL